MALVNGFSDIIAAPNLATNGNFRVNQRNLFITYANVSVNDFLVDAWKVTQLNIDICDAEVTTTEEYIALKGYGVKGQTITLTNLDNRSLGMHPNANGQITASVSLYNQIDGVKAKISCSPRQYHFLTNTMYDNSPINSGKTTGSVVTAVKVLDTHMHSSSLIHPWIKMELMASGNFNYSIRAFSEIIGAFRNPPSFSPVNYADDLARCERYYQVGETFGDGVATFVPFRTKMAGTPTITLTSGSATNITVNGFVSSGTGLHSWTSEV